MAGAILEETSAKERRTLWIEADVDTSLSLSEWALRFREWLARRDETWGGVIREMGDDGTPPR